MSFQFDSKNDQKDQYSYDKDTECILWVTITTGGGFANASYSAKCSECGTSVDLSDTPLDCPYCERSIVDVEQA